MILEKNKINSYLVEAKARKLMEVRERRKDRHKGLHTALKMRKAGSDLKFISDMTEIPEVRLQRFFNRVGV